MTHRKWLKTVNQRLATLPTRQIIAEVQHLLQIGRLDRCELHTMPRIAGIYAIRLEPVLDPERVKIGYSRHGIQRFADFLAICPTACIEWIVDGATNAQEIALHGLLHRYFTGTAEVYWLDADSLKEIRRLLETVKNRHFE